MELNILLIGQPEILPIARRRSRHTSFERDVTILQQKDDIITSHVDKIEVLEKQVKTLHTIIRRSKTDDDGADAILQEYFIANKNIKDVNRTLTNGLDALEQDHACLDALYQNAKKTIKDLEDRCPNPDEPSEPPTHTQPDRNIILVTEYYTDMLNQVAVFKKYLTALNTACGLHKDSGWYIKYLLRYYECILTDNTQKKNK